MTTLPSEPAAQDRYALRNFIALIGDYVFFSMGLAFFDAYTVIPTFIKTTVGSTVLIGALSAIRVLALNLPQILAASVLATQRRKKPFLVWSSTVGRLPLLGLALVTLLWMRSAPWLAVGALVLAAIPFLVSEALNGITWPALIGKVVPDKVRGRFFGLGQILSSLGAMGSGILMRQILGAGGWSDTTRWATIFGFAFVGTMLSVVSMLFIREQAEDRPAADRLDIMKSVRAMIVYVRSDSCLRNVVLGQIVLNIAIAAFPFFVVRAREILPGGDAMIGWFVVLQNLGGMIGALVCGTLIDHIGGRTALRACAVAETLSLLAAAAVAVLPVPQILYPLAFFLVGFTIGSMWWSFTSYLLDIATDEQRPVYLAASGILNSPTFIFSFIVGGLFQIVLPEAVLAGAAAVSLTGLVIVWRLPKRR